MKRTHSLYPNNLYRLRYAGCHPNDKYVSEIACVIITESWLNRLRCRMPRHANREPEDWVKNNADVLDAFERSVSVGDPNFGHFERLQYPCEQCGATTTLRKAHLVSVDEDGLPNHEGFPKYLCADCATEAMNGNE